MILLVPKHFDWLQHRRSFSLVRGCRPSFISPPLHPAPLSNRPHHSDNERRGREPVCFSFALIRHLLMIRIAGGDQDRGTVKTKTAAQARIPPPRKADDSKRHRQPRAMFWEAKAKVQDQRRQYKPMLLPCTMCLYAISMPTKFGSS